MGSIYKFLDYQSESKLAFFVKQIIPQEVKKKFSEQKILEILKISIFEQNGTVHTKSLKNFQFQ